MCDWGKRCGPGPMCYAGSPLLGCENLGYKCVNCAYTNLVRVGARAGQSDNTEGLLVYNDQGEFVGWQIKRPGAIGLEPFDVVTTINGVAPDESFFEVTAKEQDKPMDFTLTVYRDGKPLTLKHERR